MPRGDRTGPQGEGPLTGRGYGDCRPRGGFYGRGRSFGQGQGIGQGQGFGRGRGFGFQGNAGCEFGYDPLTLTKAEQKKILEEEKIEIQEELKRIDEKLKELK